MIYNYEEKFKICYVRKIRTIIFNRTKAMKVLKISIAFVFLSFFRFLWFIFVFHNDNKRNTISNPFNITLSNFIIALNLLFGLIYIRLYHQFNWKGFSLISLHLMIQFRHYIIEVMYLCKLFLSLFVLLLDFFNIIIFINLSTSRLIKCNYQMYLEQIGRIKILNCRHSS